MVTVGGDNGCPDAAGRERDEKVKVQAPKRLGVEGVLGG